MHNFKVSTPYVNDSRLFSFLLTLDINSFNSSLKSSFLSNLGNDITQYPFVEIKWLDIEGDSGWQDTKSLKNSKLPICVSKGYLLSQAKGITRIFTDFIETKDKPTFDNIGNTTIIPTSVIVSIKKINL